jgi:hypothetical protein
MQKPANNIKQAIEKNGDKKLILECNEKCALKANKLISLNDDNVKASKTESSNHDQDNTTTFSYFIILFALIFLVISIFVCHYYYNIY